MNINEFKDVFIGFKEFKDTGLIEGFDCSFLNNKTTPTITLTYNENNSNIIYTHPNKDAFVSYFNNCGEHYLAGYLSEIQRLEILLLLIDLSYAIKIFDSDRAKHLKEVNFFESDITSIMAAGRINNYLNKNE